MRKYPPITQKLIKSLKINLNLVTNSVTEIHSRLAPKEIESASNSGVAFKNAQGEGRIDSFTSFIRAHRLGTGIDLTINVSSNHSSMDNLRHHLILYLLYWKWLKKMVRPLRPLY